MNTGTKTEIDAAKTAFKKISPKTATRDLIENKVSNKIASGSKTKRKGDKTNKIHEIYKAP